MELVRGVSVLLVSLAFLAPASAGAQFRAVALPGDAVPGRAGEILETIREIVPLGGDRAVVVGRTTEGAAVLLLDDAGAQTLIAHAYDPAPGGGTYVTLGVVYGDGDRVVFSSSIDGVLFLFAWDGATVRRVIGEDDPIPGGRTLDNFFTVTGSDRGELLIHGAGGVYYEDASGTAATPLQFLDPVPGDPTFTVDSIEHAEISTAGLVSIACTGVDASRTIFRRYVLQGSSTSLTPAASTLDLPDASGDFALVALSRGGAIAYQYVYTTDDAGPTVEHRELWIESAGSAVPALELVDETVFPVDDRFMRWGFTSALLSDSLRLFLHGAADGVSGAASAITVQGTEWDVVHRDDQPLPGGAVEGTTFVGSSAGGEVLLSAGTGDTSGLYLWTSSGGLGRLVRAGDILEGSSAPVLGVGVPAIGHDGHIAFGAALPTASGGSESGAFMTGTSADAETDLRAVRLESETAPDAGVADLVQLVLTVENLGPTPAAFEVRLVSPGSPFAEPSSCSVPRGSCTCAGNLCTTDGVLPVGDSVAMVIAYERAASPGVTATVMPTGGVTELMPADNEITLGGRSGGGCAAASPSHGRVPPVLVLALMAWLAVASRRRDATSAVPCDRRPS